MAYEEIDYENLDDLPISEHIEWNHLLGDAEKDESSNEDWYPG
ncbi:MAG: hypothetical protein ACU841_06825 [Gammaproteobacteria bacterium]